MKEKLSSGFCAKTTKVGRHADGGNLYFLVKPDGRKSWVFRFVDPVTRKRQDMGLGRYGKHYVTLAKAREAAADARALLDEFTNPIEERKRLQREVQQAIAKRLTFKQCADKYIEAHRASWRNAKHAQQWDKRNLGDVFRDVRVALSVVKERTTHLEKGTPISITQAAKNVAASGEFKLKWRTIRNVYYKMFRSIKGPDPTEFVPSYFVKQILEEKEIKK